MKSQGKALLVGLGILVSQFSDQFLDQFGKTPELVWIGPETDSRPKNQKIGQQK